MRNSHRPFLPLAFVTIVLCFGFVNLYYNQSSYMRTVAENMEAGNALNLDENLSASELSQFLQDHNYVSDPKDAAFISDQIVRKLDTVKTLPNLGALNTKRFKVSTTLADSMGGSLTKGRVLAARQRLGWDNTVEALYAHPGLLKQKDSFPHCEGDDELIVIITRPDTAKTFINRLLRKIGKPRHHAADGVLVILRQHDLVCDTARENGKPIMVKGSPKMDTMVRDTIAEYAFTDSRGEVTFKISRGSSYSVLPVKAGFNYGSPKGKLKDKKAKKLKFAETADKITLFDTYTYNRLKGDSALTVRTREQYRNHLIISFILFIAMWWLVYAFVTIRDRKQNKRTDTLLMAILMTLTGLGLLVKFAIANPLSDMLLGTSALTGTLIGLVLLALVVRFDVIGFFNNGLRLFGLHMDFDFAMQFMRWANLPFGQKLDNFSADLNRRTNNGVVKVIVKVIYLIVLLLLLPVILIVKLITLGCSKIPKLRDITLPNASGYLLLALALLVLLFIFGSGPEGSGAKVNLGSVQVSEVVKFLTMIFVAAFFADNSDKLQAFSEKQEIFGKRQIKLVGLILCFMALLMLVFIGLSDCGPAMVVMLSFILIYSVARRDTVKMFIGVGSFVALLFIANWVNHSYLLMGFAAIVWLGLWVGISWARKKRIYESAIFFNLIIAILLFGGPVFETIGLHDIAKRLGDRNEMVWSGVWDNEVKGGDQVAQGYWALASGGIAGQGLGKGHPNVIPAFHTDMILSSVGEEMGWATLLLIVICMAILVHRSLLIARKVGNRFAFFLVAGLAIVTGMQFLVIVLGSLGLIPLTGVTVPLMSHGNSSLIINLIIFGVILSLSRENATERQAEYIRGKYDNIIAMGSASFIAVGVFIICWLLGYQFFARNSTLIRPAFVTNTQGARVVEYNPRIDILMRKLDAGNIYDRNGVLLATSVDSLLNDNKIVNKIVDAGIDRSAVDKEHRYPQRRYYPFGNDLFFMLGDFNTKVLWGSHDNNPYGYMAESRHLASLRGFDNIKRDKNGKPEKQMLKSHNYVYSPFLTERGYKEFSYTLYDYSPLLPMLKAGDDSRKVRKWNEERPSRDITMTIDAKLQVKLQRRLAQFAAPRKNDYMRISVVVLDAQRGDLLCSANYPLPNQDTIVAKSNLPYYSDNYKDFKAYTDRDLGMTFQSQPGSTAKVMSAMAGFMKLGSSAANKHYMVYDEEKVDTKLGEPTGSVNLHDAIVQSSNCYFVNSVNDMDLYPQLFKIYQAAGMRIDKEIIDAKGRTVIEKSLTPYFFYQSENIDTSDYRAEVSNMGSRGRTKYTNYITRRTEKQEFHKMNWSVCAWAWGQGTMRATPLNMARVASIVVNNGSLPQPRYLVTDTILTDRVSETSLENLKSYMKDQARQKGGISNPAIGGKTGTPERTHVYRDKNGNRVAFKGDRNGRRTSSVHSENDAWYIFFVDKEGVNQSKAKKLAVAVRIERAKATSGLAMELTRSQVIPALTETGYMK